LSPADTLSYHFPVADSQFYGTGGVKLLEEGVWGLFAGDGNSDGGIYAEDYTRFRANQGEEGYLSSDYSLDGGVYAEDYTQFRKNQGKETSVP